ncbi:MAG: M1 family peptidase, partial [Chloroflexi bacterium]
MHRILTLSLILFLLLPFPRSAAHGAPAAAEPQDIASYSIAVRLDPDQRLLDGQETITYRNTTQKPIPDLVFHLYLNAFKDTETIFMQEGGPQHRGNRFTPLENGWIDVDSLRLQDGTPLKLELQEDGTLARAVLPQPVLPGQSVQVAVEFRAQLPKVFARTGWARDAQGDLFFMVGQWFPKLGVWTEAGWNAYPFHAMSEFFADFGRYDVQIRLPRGWQTAGTGLPTGTVDNGDGTQTVTYEARNVIDFAWTASP